MFISLPFEPEPFDQLVARFPKALERIWAMDEDPREIVMDRIYVFDFDGDATLPRFRAIVSMEQHVKMQLLHFSLSVENGIPDPRLSMRLISRLALGYKFVVYESSMSEILDFTVAHFWGLLLPLTPEMKAALASLEQHIAAGLAMLHNRVNTGASDN
jgi:hypothetical protein